VAINTSQTLVPAIEVDSTGNGTTGALGNGSRAGCAFDFGFVLVVLLADGFAAGDSTGAFGAAASLAGLAFLRGRSHFSQRIP